MENLVYIKLSFLFACFLWGPDREHLDVFDVYDEFMPEMSKTGTPCVFPSCTVIKERMITGTVTWQVFFCRYPT
jgi:hypothetical protein